jgi:hypothetical protein
MARDCNPLLASLLAAGVVPSLHDLAAAVLARIELPTEIAVERSRHLPTRKLRPAPTDKAISARLMPDVRCRVCRVVHRPVVRYCKHEIAPLTLNGRSLRGGPTRQAIAVTAAYIQAFFPSWGRSTTPTLVKKSLRRKVESEGGLFRSKRPSLSSFQQ